MVERGRVERVGEGKRGWRWGECGEHGGEGVEQWLLTNVTDKKGSMPPICSSACSSLSLGHTHTHTHIHTPTAFT